MFPALPAIIHHPNPVQIAEEAAQISEDMGISLDRAACLIRDMEDARPFFIVGA